MSTFEGGIIGALLINVLHFDSIELMNLGLDMLLLSFLSRNDFPINELSLVSEEVFHRKITAEYHANAFWWKLFLFKQTFNRNIPFHYSGGIVVAPLCSLGCFQRGCKISLISQICVQSILPLFLMSSLMPSKYSVLVHINNNCLVMVRP